MCHPTSPSALSPWVHKVLKSLRKLQVSEQGLSETEKEERQISLQNIPELRNCWDSWVQSS